MVIRTQIKQSCIQKASYNDKIANISWGKCCMIIGIYALDIRP